MNGRPKIAVPLTKFDKVVELTAFVLLIVLWTTILTNFHDLPSTIPIHFNAAGNPDRYGSKSSILTLPVTASIIYVAITILNRYPHLYNYPTTITTGNALKHYTTATRMIRVLKLVVVVIFSMLVFTTFSVAEKKAPGLGRWFLPVVILLLVVPNLLFILKPFRKRAKGNS
jgi:uncharacterized membrane protein